MQKAIADEGSKATRKAFAYWIIFMAALFCFLAYGLLWPPPSVVTKRYCAEFLRNRDRYQAIVQKVSEVKVSNNQTQPTILEVSSDRDPASLKGHGPDMPTWWTQTPSDLERLVRAWREPGGRLVIVFTMQATRHGGIWSLVYTNPPSLSGEHLRYGDQVTQIDSHWRAIYDGTD